MRRAAREIGEQVSCDARYVGRVESGEIKCPNYAYERVFRHMFPGNSLQDLGFAPREKVRGRWVDGPVGPGLVVPCGPVVPRPQPWLLGGNPEGGVHEGGPADFDLYDEESDVLRRAFMTGGPAAITAALSLERPAAAAPLPEPPAAAPPPVLPRARGVPRRVGRREARAVEEAVRQIRVLDDRHGADALYRQAGRSLRTAYLLLDEGSYDPRVAGLLHSGAGELAISVGWLAHDCGRLDDARSYYAEALSTARMAGDPALEAHAFCNTAFLARDAGRPREAVRAAQAARQAAKKLSSPRLMSLLSLREAGGWAGLRDRSSCERALKHAHRQFDKGPGDRDPEWMSFFGPGELAGLEAQCWSALGDYERAAEHARRAVEFQDGHFVRNIALFTAELAHDLTGRGEVVEAAHQGRRVLGLLDQVNSSRIRGMIGATARTLTAHRANHDVAAFLDAYEETSRGSGIPA
ncbi:hypothetical protein GCM10012280_30590 [Wenjunlia tyrosinilytica]|uniref:Tetratricopeptide repeat protein n=1 Tax=Wenjunlia tyrosinilytica TaxID=1544741 RepID=A0A918DXN2_9ACTN|nr:hypothetical protein GCM10012280_30590 [Wenjunlia tyrosinilytica]